MECKLIDSDFWDKFVEQNWEKSAFSMERAFETPPIQPSALFKSVVTCVTDFPAHVGVRFYVGTALQTLYIGHAMLPQTSDNSFEEYNRRLRGQLNAQDYCLIITNIESVDFELWNWSREFLYGLYEKIGFNKLGVYYGLFIGNYSKTPFGVHRDPESIFHIPVVGRKTLRTWDGGYEAMKPGIVRAHDYSEFVVDSVKVEAGPGGILYWPSPAWHIAERSDDFSVSLGLSLNCFPSIAQGLTQRAEIDPSGLVPPDFDPCVKFSPDNLGNSAVELPPDFKAASVFMENLNWEVIFHKQWIKLVTGYNFMYPPQPELMKVMRRDATISGNAKYPIVAVNLAGDQLAVSANGHLIDLPSNDVFVKIIKKVNDGQSVKVTSLIHDLNFEMQQSVLRLLSWLESVRSIKVSSVR
ncbi:MAG: hypothetical protein ABIS36_21380 [Chryseolinea sp.]